MKLEEFISKYGNENVTFSEMYKFRVIYKNTELGIIVRGTAEYRDDLTLIETISSISQLENFDFEFTNQPPHLK